ncbi:cytochrome P450 [Iodobacter fluviatilis]|uniref:Cytochrome n=1 Tax=Iodobacter fluviatilis TaxID=537 RepID=A0A7G3GA11_9NEIS|nr:cytochrome P450 [Iodobacter fluviatilis]QBC43912.1 cytochrome [Iodobacter fluviatilis]
MPPIHAIAAATHPNPYPYYASLRATTPFFFDTELACWVASTAELVGQIMQNPHCQVLAPASASRAAELFSRLIRMNEGEAHAPLKRRLQQGLAELDLSATHLLLLTQRWLKRLPEGPSLNTLCRHLPVLVLADALGFAPQLRLVEWISQLVAYLSAFSSEAERLQASVAAEHLLAHFSGLRPEHCSLLLQEFNQQVVLANLIGLLTQSYEATAGLLGNSLIALAQNPEVYQRILAGIEPISALVESVAVQDPSVQNTRRVVTQAIEIYGQQLAVGDTILLLLASANHDASSSEHFSFGYGRHACPGQALATRLATVILDAYLCGENRPLPVRWAYQASANARIPQFN